MGLTDYIITVGSWCFAFGGVLKAISKDNQEISVYLPRSNSGLVSGFGANV